MFSLLSKWVATGIGCLNSPLESEPNDLEAAIIIKKVLHIHEKLAAKEHLRPSLEVNELFSELVDICTKTIPNSITNEVLSNSLIITIILSLRSLCSTAESYLESHWASEIAGNSSSSTPEDSSIVVNRLKTFPYYTNYLDLTRLELSALTSVSHTPISRIAFIGSGPLPLSSLFLSGALPIPGLPPRPDTQVLGIDFDKTAILQAENLCQKLRVYENKMRFLHKDAKDLDTEELEDIDVVFIAALVGRNQGEKEGLLRGIVEGMREGGLVVLRGAERGRRLLYAEFDPTTEGVLECLDICLVVHPFNHVVNSVIVGRVKEKKRS